MAENLGQYLFSFPLREKTYIYLSQYITVEREKNTAHPQERSFLIIIEQINPYMSNPCHIELILTEGEEVVQKSDEVVGRERLTARQRAVRARKAITAA